MIKNSGGLRQFQDEERNCRQIDDEIKKSENNRDEVFGGGKMDLKVRIPVKFRKGLEARFNLENVQYENGYYSIGIPCPLCESYYKCFECPFQKFRKDERGCIIWIKSVISQKCGFVLSGKEIYWREENHSLAVEQLNLLNEKAKELIEWIKVKNEKE